MISIYARAIIDGGCFFVFMIIKTLINDASAVE
jgi:hypothetical protein